jgi:S-adenosylmethionine:tRNA ribosyltransferase-isomerase
LDISHIDYELPEELIAQTPIEPRDSARLLVDSLNGLQHRHVSDIVEYLKPGDVMVVNHTRVLPARLKLKRRTGGAVEVLLLEERDAEQMQWEALVRPGGKLSVGEELLGSDGDGAVMLRIGERSPAGDTFFVHFVANSHDEVMRRIVEVGEIPLPPYITTALADQNRYQTVFSHDQKSSAAPTAGLHFTPELLDRIRDAGVEIREVELVVGLDTFQPISAENPLDHVIHTESYRVPAETFNSCLRARESGGRVIAIGTTATRALESAATFGELQGRTNLFITPGYEWKVVDMMMTNFHMPRTTLLLMVESFIGVKWRTIYSEAIAMRYRMLSFGDAMLLYRGTNVSS